MFFLPGCHLPQTQAEIRPLRTRGGVAAAQLIVRIVRTGGSAFHYIYARSAKKDAATGMATQQCSRTAHGAEVGSRGPPRAKTRIGVGARPVRGLRPCHHEWGGR